jgi:hypothetical protein
LARNVSDLKAKVLGPCSPNLDPEALNHLRHESLRSNRQPVLSDWKRSYLIPPGFVSHSPARYTDLRVTGDYFNTTNQSTVLIGHQTLN